MTECPPTPAVSSPVKVETDLRCHEAPVTASTQSRLRWRQRGRGSSVTSGDSRGWSPRRCLSFRGGDCGWAGGLPTVYLAHRHPRHLAVHLRALTMRTGGGSSFWTLIGRHMHYVLLGRSGQEKAGEGRGGQDRVGLGKAGDDRAEEGRARQGRVGDNRAGESRAGQSRARQGRGRQ